MRYDTPIFFQKLKKGAYNEQTGDYLPDVTAETKIFADVTETGTEMLQFVYGKVQQSSFTIRLQRPYKEAFDHIRIGDKIFNVDFARRRKVFVVSEVQ